MYGWPADNGKKTPDSIIFLSLSIIALTASVELRVLRQDVLRADL